LPASKSAASRPWYHSGWAASLLLIVVTWLTYANSLSGEFIFDDHAHIVENQKVDDFGHAIRQFAGPRNRPVAGLSIAVNATLFGKDPFWFRVVNVLIHTLCVLLLYDLIRGSVAAIHPGDKSNCPPADTLALAAALLWAVHPLATMAVSYIIQRHESLMAMFYLAMLWFLMRGYLSVRWKWPWYLGAILACWLGMGTKEVMITAPVVGLMYDRALLSKSWGDLLRNRGWVYGVIVSPAIILIFKLVPMFTPGTATFEDMFGQHEQASSWLYLWTQTGVILHYLQLSFWPNQLVFDYQWPVADSPAQYWMSAMVVTALFAGAVSLWWKNPPIGFLGLAFFFILAPTSSFVPVIDVAFEHRMYLPLAVVCILFALGLYLLLQRAMGESSPNERTAGFMIVVGIVGVLLAYRTYERNRDYQSEIAMWYSVVEARPQNTRANHNLAQYLRQQGEIAEAELVLLRSIRACEDIGERTFPLHVDLAELYVGAGQVNLALGRYQLALETGEATTEQPHSDYSQAILNRQLAEMYTSFGAFMLQLGHPQQAAIHLDKAIALRPEIADWYAMAGDAQRQSGNIPKAIEYWNHLLSVNPQQDMVRRDLALELLHAKDYEKAMPHLLELVNRNSDDIAASFHLARLLVAAPDDNVRDLQLGTELIRESSSRFPDLSKEWDTLLAIAVGNTGDYDQAAAQLRKIREQLSSNEDPLLQIIDPAIVAFDAKRNWYLPSQASSD